MERRGTTATASCGGGGSDEPPLPRCLPAHHRRASAGDRCGDRVSFAREGLVFIAIAALIAAVTYAIAINRRSWGLWLVAFSLTILALWVAYFFRDPERTGP